jgi:hypothetical protein
MKGGRPYETNWSRIEVAPQPEYYDDFAELARQVALRYPDVRYYLVWNELKGFWNSSARDWDFTAYTRLYNEVYDALKSVDPDLKVGGPYMIIEGTGTERANSPPTAKPIIQRNLRGLEYWLGNKRGADFIALDRGLRDFHDSTSYSDAELLALTSQYARVVQQVQARTALPIWFVEDGFVGSPDWDLQAVGLASVLLHELRSGVAVSLRWAPQAQPNAPNRGNDQNLFTDTTKPGGGQPLPNYDVYRAFNQTFPPGTTLYKIASSSPDVEALASDSAVLLLNKRPRPVTVGLNGDLLCLGRYDVAVIRIAVGRVADDEPKRC